MSEIDRERLIEIDDQLGHAFGLAKLLAQAFDNPDTDVSYMEGGVKILADTLMSMSWALSAVVRPAPAEEVAR